MGRPFKKRVYDVDLEQEDESLSQASYPLMPDAISSVSTLDPFLEMRKRASAEPEPNPLLSEEEISGPVRKKAAVTSFTTSAPTIMIKSDHRSNTEAHSTLSPDIIPSIETPVLKERKRVFEAKGNGEKTTEPVRKKAAVAPATTDKVNLPPKKTVDNSSNLQSPQETIGVSPIREKETAARSVTPTKPAESTTTTPAITATSSQEQNTTNQKTAFIEASPSEAEKKPKKSKTEKKKRKTKKKSTPVPDLVTSNVPEVRGLVTPESKKSPKLIHIAKSSKAGRSKKADFIPDLPESNDFVAYNGLTATETDQKAMEETSYDDQREEPGRIRLQAIVKDNENIRSRMTLTVRYSDQSDNEARELSSIGKTMPQSNYNPPTPSDEDPSTILSCSVPSFAHVNESASWRKKVSPFSAGAFWSEELDFRRSKRARNVNVRYCEMENVVEEDESIATKQEAETVLQPPRESKRVKKPTTWYKDIGEEKDVIDDGYDPVLLLKKERTKEILHLQREKVDKERKKYSHNNVGYENAPGWDAKFHLLVEYQKKHGHTRVPRTSPKFSYWIREQRYLHKNEKLSKQRVDLLNSIGFEWSILVPWEGMYAKLVDYYKANNGSTRVPKHPKKSKRLGSWVIRQRKSYADGKLAKDKIEKLESLNFEWNPIRSEWMKQYQHLVQYVKENGHSDVPVAYNSTLYQWVRTQRRECTQTYRIDLLDDINFDWDGP